MAGVSFREVREVDDKKEDGVCWWTNVRVWVSSNRVQET